MNYQCKQKGFTIIEVLVSMVIFGIVMASLPVVYLTQARINERMEAKAGAMAAGQQILDKYRSIDPLTLPESGTLDDEILNINGRNYVIETSFCENINFCSNASNRHIKLRVHYKENEIAQLETVYTRLK